MLEYNWTYSDNKSKTLKEQTAKEMKECDTYSEKLLFYTQRNLIALQQTRMSREN